MRSVFLIMFILIVGVLLVISLVFSQKKETQSPEKISKKTGFSVFAPGRTTKDVVLKKAGPPSSIERSGNKTYFYYETRNSSLRDFVVLENGLEIYALENIFANERLSLESFTKSFGKYEIYYSTTNPFLWYVFLEKGIALETDEKSILKILYFSPQTENQFLTSIAFEVGISKKPPTPEVLRP